MPPWEETNSVGSIHVVPSLPINLLIAIIIRMNHGVHKLNVRQSISVNRNLDDGLPRFSLSASQFLGETPQEPCATSSGGHQVRIKFIWREECLEEFTNSSVLRRIRQMTAVSVMSTNSRQSQLVEYPPLERVRPLASFVTLSKNIPVQCDI